MDPLVINLNAQTLLDDIDLEVSKVAVRTRKDGVSMYDILKIYTSDDPLVENALNDSIRSVVSQFHDVATEGTSSIVFNVPDFDPANVDTLEEEIRRYLASRTVADWFLTRLPDMAQYFATLSVECLGRATTLLRHRKRVER